jgi:hypothetical protein
MLSAGPDASRFAYSATVVGRAAVAYILIGWKCTTTYVALKRHVLGVHSEIC